MPYRGKSYRRAAPDPQENQDVWQRTGGEFVSGPPPEKPSTPEKPAEQGKPAKVK